MNTCTLTCSILLAAAPWAALAQTTFTKITEGNIVNDLEIFVFPAWGDFNNDGFLDLFVSVYGGTNIFYRNNGNGSFTKIAQGDPVQDADRHVGASWGDYDNDGNLDLLVAAGLLAQTTSRTLLYHNNGDGTLSRVSGGSITNELGTFGASSWADYDNDGFLDVFINNTPDDVVGGKNLLFHNNGNGTFTKVASGRIVNDLGVGWDCLWADYDNDGFMDLLVVNEQDSPNAVNFLYRNNRDGTFTRILTNAVATDKWPEHAICGAWGDYDNDGFQDLFITTGYPAQNRLYHNNGDGTFTKITSGPMLFTPAADGADSTGCAWGDYDNDGFLDLFIASSGGKNQLFRNNGDGTFTKILSGDPVNDGDAQTFYGAVAWVDYDNDGFVDLFVTGKSSGGTKSLLYHNTGNSHAWLEVKCVGTVSNRAAIGAKVRVLATIAGKTFWQLREINGGSGFNSVPLVAHFGLGATTNIDVLRIEWPSGIVQEFRNVAAKQFLTITEPPRLLVSVTDGVPQFSLKGGRGFQYQIEASTDLGAWSPLGTLTITNLSGTAQITDPNALGANRRFYRAVSR